MIGIHVLKCGFWPGLIILIMDNSKLLSLCEAAEAICSKRTKAQEHEAALKEEGWELVDISRQSIRLTENFKNITPQPNLSFPSNASLLHIFESQISADLVATILENRKEEMPVVFT